MIPESWLAKFHLFMSRVIGRWSDWHLDRAGEHIDGAEELMRRRSRC